MDGTHPVNYAGFRGVKGAAAGVHEQNPEETARVDVQVLLQTVLRPTGTRVSTPGQTVVGAKTHLATYLDMTTNPSWSGLDISFEKTTDELKGARLLRLLVKGNIFKSMKISYMGLVQPDFSIDLVGGHYDRENSPRRSRQRRIRNLILPQRWRRDVLDIINLCF
jgi:hypothetical protein